jgi:hypothetical protein
MKMVKMVHLGLFDYTGVEISWVSVMRRFKGGLASCVITAAMRQRQPVNSHEYR